MNPASGDPQPDVSEIVLPLHEEELVTGKRLVETATVRVATTTVITDRQVDEQLQRTSVLVERLPVGRTVDAVPPIREEGDTIIIPVVEEVVVVERRLVLREEIRVRRVRTTVQHVETVTLREQQATVERLPAATLMAALPHPDPTQPKLQKGPHS